MENRYKEALSLISRIRTKYTNYSFTNSISDEFMLELVIEELLYAFSKSDNMILQRTTTETAKKIWYLSTDDKNQIKYCLGLSWRLVWVLKQVELIKLQSFSYKHRTNVELCDELRYENIEKYIRLPGSEVKKVRFRTTRVGVSNTRPNMRVVNILQNVAVRYSKKYLLKAIKTNIIMSQELGSKVGYYLENINTGTDQYLSVCIDQRGRYYYSEVIGSIQSVNHEKAILSFANLRETTESGRKWMKVAIANEDQSHKLDSTHKEYREDRVQDMTYANRVKWFDESDKNHLTIYGNRLLEEYNKRYTSIPIGFDMTSSGPSIMGLLMGCRTTLSNVGIVGDRRTSIPLELMKKMNCSLDDAKRASMTYFYGSVREPRRVFGTKVDEFKMNMEEIATGATLYLEEMNRLWSILKRLGLDEVKYSIGGRDYSYHLYTTLKEDIVVRFPRGFVSSKHYMNLKAPNPGSRALGVNILHSIDSLLLEKVVLGLNDAAVEDIIVNHDSFYVHPNDVDLLMSIYKASIKEIYSMDILSDIENSLKENYGFKFKFKRVNDVDAKSITVKNSLN